MEKSIAVIRAGIRLYRKEVRVKWDIDKSVIHSNSYKK